MNRVIYAVFGVPVPYPSRSEFLGAYTTEARAQRFVDAQEPAVQANLRVTEVTLDAHASDSVWAKPPAELDALDEGHAHGGCDE